MEEPAETPFAELCDQMEWSTPAAFISMYEKAAEQLGESPQLSARQVRRWRADKPPCPHPGRQRVVEAMFGKPLEQLGFDVPPHRRNPVTAALQLPAADAAPLEGPNEDVNRRTFMQATSAAALGAAVPSGLGGPDPHASRVGTDAVTTLRDDLARLYGLDDRYGGEMVGPLARAHLARVERLMDTGSYPETIGRQLRLIAGETAEHAGWLAFDAGDNPLARFYWAQAMKRADDLGDDSLAVLVRASMSLLSLREDEPRHALDHARCARERAKRWAPPKLLSILVVREARALATLGDHSAARTVLADAWRLYERDKGTRPAPEWTTFHGPAELCHAQAHLFTALGHHGAAVTWLRRSLERQESSYARNEALGRGALASALLLAGEPEEAAHHISAGEALMGEVSSGRARLALAHARQELTRLAPTA